MNELLLRRMVAASKSLPYDAEIEYLQSSGTQYIDTGYYPNDATVLSAKYYNQPSNQCPFAARWSGANTYDTFGVFVGIDEQIVYYGRVSDSKVNRISISNSKNIELDIDLTQIKINDITISITRGSFVSTYTMYVFAMNVMGTASFNSQAKLYKMTIKENNTTIFDFIPVRKGQVGYLYDKVSGQLFGNSGTGSFILGLDVETISSRS